MHRVLPELTPDSEFFWKSGADKHLRFLRCSRCSAFVHPPLPICPACHTRDPKPEIVSGNGVVAGFTINHQAWTPELREPYVIGLVEIEEQRSVRLTTNIVNCELGAVYIGMPVKVVFEQHAEIFLPLFEPSTSGER